MSIRYECGQCDADVTDLVTGACQAPTTVAPMLALVTATSQAPTTVAPILTPKGMQVVHPASWVTVTCPNNHTCSYPCGGNQHAEDEIIKGKGISAEEKAEYDSLRAVFDPRSAMDRLDSYSKWLFGSAVVVASLGAGLSNAAFSKLRGPGVWCFAAALGAFTVCLVAAALSIGPKWVQANIFNLNQLRQAVEAQFKARRLLLTVSAIFFPIALALAGLSPLLSLAAQPVLVVHFSVVEPGKLDAGLEATGLKPGTVAVLDIEGTTAGVASLPRASATADENGHVQLTLKMANAATLTGTPELVGCLRRLAETKCFEERRIPLPMQEVASISVSQTVAFSRDLRTHDQFQLRNDLSHHCVILATRLCEELCSVGAPAWGRPAVKGFLRELRKASFHACLKSKSPIRCLLHWYPAVQRTNVLEPPVFDSFEIIQSYLRLRRSRIIGARTYNSSIRPVNPSSPIESQG